MQIVLAPPALKTTHFNLRGQILFPCGALNTQSLKCISNSEYSNWRWSYAHTLNVYEIQADRLYFRLVL